MARPTWLPALCAMLVVACSGAAPTDPASEVRSITVSERNYADEATDYGVAPRTSPKGPPFHQPTPLTVPGAKTITTAQLRDMLAGGQRIVLIDVLEGNR